MLTSAAQEELYEMVKAIYNHLGLDGKRPSSMNDVKEQAEREVVLIRLHELLDDSSRTQ